MSDAGELVKSTPSLAQLAVAEYKRERAELAEYEDTLRRSLGKRPGTPTVGEREAEAATAEALGILGYNVERWRHGDIRYKGHVWHCLLTEIPGSDTTLLLYFPGQSIGLAALTGCGWRASSRASDHQHIRKLTSLADLGDALQWRPVDCMAERLLPPKERRTVWIRHESLGD
jgi:hypothetical protein